MNNDDDDDEVLDPSVQGNDPKSELYANLAQRLTRDPRSGEGLIQARQMASDTVNRNALYQALSQSMGQIGSVGGKIAGSAPVATMAQAGDQAAMMGVQGAQDQAKSAEQDRQDLMKYLSQKSALEFKGKKQEQDLSFKQKNLEENTRHHGVLESQGGQKSVINQGKADDKTDKDQEKRDAESKKSLERAQGAMNHDTAELRKQVDAADSVDGEIDEALKNPVAASGLPIRMARLASGGGRINEVEINKLGGSQAVTDRLDQIVTTMTSGTLSKENYRYMKDVAAAIKVGAKKSLANRQKMHAQQFAQRSGGNVDEAYADLTGGEKLDTSNIADAAPPAPSGQPSGTAYAAPAGVSPPPQAGGIPAVAHPEVDQATQWANANANNPDPQISAKAQAILKRIGR